MPAKIFLVVVSVWSMAYHGIQQTPALIHEMPSLEACQAVGKSILEMSPDAKFACVVTK